ncbi:hypothetical protein WJX74_003403 [Apatococcus lobatus]|uniref:3-deoxy-manno-octulosonate cytidylyltransferase n=2 Tax=Apatococcus TaxID=904362 RepID=A0AAW1S1H4_9CHLO
MQGSGRLALKAVLGFWLLAGAAIASVIHLQNRKRRKSAIGVIPARYASGRFPGKPLVDIRGKPMIVRTYLQAKKALTLDRLVVATDDIRIAAACEVAGAEVIMTSENCANGTERCHEAVCKLKAKHDIVVNIQGDEPLVEPAMIDEVVEALREKPEAVFSTACTPMERREVPLRHRVKCILDQKGFAIYFSRGVLPANKAGDVRPFPTPHQDKPYLLHLGLQAYDRNFLGLYCQMPPTPLMLMEDLEQLKVLENGYKMKVVIVDHCAHGVDVPADVDDILRIMRDEGLQ